jgi:Zn-dependent peptidase ImmA (M78 family)
MTENDARDAEANAFAMELLMPFDWIVRDTEGLDLCDDHKVAKIAKKYAVPHSVMAARIASVRAELFSKETT